MLDRSHKGSAYARAAVPEYWIVNLADDVLETYREPVPDPAADFGWRYGRASLLREGTVAPLARPNITIAIVDLFP